MTTFLWIVLVLLLQGKLVNNILGIFILNYHLSRPKKKRKMNRTGFPSPKKKKVVIKNDINNLGNPKVKLDKNLVKNNLKSSPSSSSTVTKSISPDSEVAKKKVTKQIKMDRFITKSSKPTKSEAGAVSPKRSVTQKPKNYR